MNFFQTSKYFCDALIMGYMYVGISQLWNGIFISHTTVSSLDLLILFQIVLCKSIREENFIRSVGMVNKKQGSYLCFAKSKIWNKSWVANIVVCIVQTVGVLVNRQWQNRNCFTFTSSQTLGLQLTLSSPGPAKLDFRCTANIAAQFSGRSPYSAETF